MSRAKTTKVIYNGPQPEVVVPGVGTFKKGEIVKVSSKVAASLLEQSIWSEHTNTPVETPADEE